MTLYFLKMLTLSIIFLNNASAQNQIVVSAQEPQIEQVSDILELPGSVLANESVKITSVVSEKIDRILFEEGMFVRKNQLLIELLDNEEKAVLNQVTAELEEANINYNRALKLSEKGNISQSMLDNRLMIKKKLSGKINEISALLEDHRIKAPFDGFTGIRNFSEGSFIKPGDVITELHDIKTLKIQAYVPESFSNKIQKGNIFYLDKSNNIPKNISGKISVIDPIIDKNTRSFRVIGKIENPENKIKPGMMVNLKIPLDERKSYVIRENAIVKEDDISSVFIVNKDNKIIKRKVEVGIINNGMVEIIEGVKSKDIIVIEGINKIQEGSVVKVK